MKYYLAWVLYYLGHLHSKFPDCLFYYPFYNWCMRNSWLLDVDEKIWKLPEKEETNEME